MKSPLIIVAACFACGVLVARPDSIRAPSIPLLLTFAGTCLLLGVLALRAKWPRASLLFLLAGFVGAGASAAGLFEFRFPPNHVRRLEALGVDLEDPVRLEGVVVSTPSRTPYGLQFDLEVRRLESVRRVHSLSGRVRLRLQTAEDPESAALADSLQLQFGDSIRTLAKLRRPRVYQNPGSFDFRRWMESIEDIYWVGTIKSPLLVEKIPGSTPPQPAAFLERMRHRLLRGIDGLFVPWSAEGRSGAVLKAVLLGDRTSLDSDTIENFRKTGLYHLLVIAGLHVGLLAMLVGMFFRILRVRSYGQSVLILMFLLGYAALVEQRAPTLRATIMICIYLVGRLLYREHSALNAVGFAALLLLLHRPPWLFESGFQLSFAAALLIAGLVVPIVERTTELYRRALWQLHDVDHDINLLPRQAQFRLDLRSLVSWLRSRAAFLGSHPTLSEAIVTRPVRAVLWAANMLLFSAILQLGLLLPMAETFHRVTFAGVGLNALAIPAMTLVLALALPTVLLSALAPALAAWPAKALALAVSGLFTLTDLPNLPAWLSYRIPEPPGWVAWGFALSILLAGLTLPRSLRAFWASLAALVVFGALLSLHPFAPRLPSGVLEVTALDCGGGEAIFVVLPDRTTLLVDAGGSRNRTTQAGAFQGRRWDPGEDIVSPYLWSRGIRQVDILVLSHAHEDHLGGLSAVVRNFRIGEFWHGQNATTPTYQALLELVGQRGIPNRDVAAGDLIARGGATIRVLWPKPGWPASAQPSNDDSVVLRIGHDATGVLLPGDVSQRVEEELLSSGAPLESRLLKVAHHGAKSSSTAEFLRRVSPRLALVTAEGGGFMSLPSPETLARLRAAGARICRTDRDGAVTVEMRGSSLFVRSYRTSPAEGAARVAGAGSAGGATSRVR
jgi:competence protein ComEC